MQDFSQQVLVECITCAMIFKCEYSAVYKKDTNPCIHSAYILLNLSYFRSVLFKAKSFWVCEVFFLSFIFIYFTSHTIRLHKMGNSKVFRTFTDLCNHQNNLILEHFHHSPLERNIIPVRKHSLPSPSP